ncbi:hypothetical protein BO71DRAFT_424889 [Aspergillus ellipticus CBS 707.79]|uniref:Uncharacterized protein n=1 Tax=Aspergillus ellipticus CBS 707.79 TaxID=1448320 RepID=A0A319DQE5_9EURO|nr:hypothetical protein BO71DRAFT_424889 [Aspergillus ellipticus CBS 707.79]
MEWPANHNDLTQDHANDTQHFSIPRSTFFQALPAAGWNTASQLGPIQSFATNFPGYPSTGTCSTPPTGGRAGPYHLDPIAALEADFSAASTVGMGVNPSLEHPSLYGFSPSNTPLLQDYGISFPNNMAMAHQEQQARPSSQAARYNDDVPRPFSCGRMFIQCTRITACAVFNASGKAAAIPARSTA